jgi:hypothetical protein
MTPLIVEKQTMLMYFGIGFFTFLTMIVYCNFAVKKYGRLQFRKDTQSAAELLSFGAAFLSVIALVAFLSDQQKVSQRTSFTMATSLVHDTFCMARAPSAFEGQVCKTVESIKSQVLCDENGHCNYRGYLENIEELLSNNIANNVLLNEKETKSAINIKNVVKEVKEGLASGSEIDVSPHFKSVILIFCYILAVSASSLKLFNTRIGSRYLSCARNTNSVIVTASPLK